MNKSWGILLTVVLVATLTAGVAFHGIGQGNNGADTTKQVNSTGNNHVSDQKTNQTRRISNRIGSVADKSKKNQIGNVDNGSGNVSGNVSKEEIKKRYNLTDRGRPEEKYDFAEFSQTTSSKQRRSTRHRKSRLRHSRRTDNRN
ncbi:MAG: hypothetical protein ABEK59_07485 [Halobacteria archaeon]